MFTILTALFWLLVLAYLAKWVFTPSDPALPEKTQRTEAEIARLREDLERLAADLERLRDEQSFMVRLLSESEKRMLEKGQTEDRE